MKKIKTLLAISLLSLSYIAIGQNYSRIPFTMKRHLHFNAVIADSVNACLIFDTGCPYLLLDSAFAKEHKDVVGTVRPGAMRGTGNNFEMISVARHPIIYSVGGLADTSKMTTILDLKKIVGCEADGLLGLPFFRNSVVQFDFDSNFIILHNHGFVPDSSYTLVQGTTVDANGKILVPLTLTIGNDCSVADVFCLDMGFPGGIALSKYAAEKYGLKSKIKNGVQHSNAVGGIGGASAEVMFVGKKLSIAGITIDTIEAEYSLNSGGVLGESEYKYKGLLGNSVLKRFDLIIDFPNKKIYILKKTTYKPIDMPSVRALAVKSINCSKDIYAVSSFVPNHPLAVENNIQLGDTVLMINGINPAEYDFDNPSDKMELTIQRGSKVIEVDNPRIYLNDTSAF